MVDNDGNIVDKHGSMVFEKEMVSKDGEIPLVFRSGVLKLNSAGSEMSKLMEEIEKDHEPQVYGETSLDSQMEDTPANYN